MLGESPVTERRRDALTQRFAVCSSNSDVLIALTKVLDEGNEPLRELWPQLLDCQTLARVWAGYMNSLSKAQNHTGQVFGAVVGTHNQNFETLRTQSCLTGQESLHDKSVLYNLFASLRHEVLDFQRLDSNPKDNRAMSNLQMGALFTGKVSPPQQGSPVVKHFQKKALHRKIASGRCVPQLSISKTLPRTSASKFHFLPGKGFHFANFTRTAPRSLASTDVLTPLKNPPHQSLSHSCNGKGTAAQ